MVMHCNSLQSKVRSSGIYCWVVRGKRTQTTRLYFTEYQPAQFFSIASPPTPPPIQSTEKSFVLIYTDLLSSQSSLMAQMVKRLPAMRGTWVQSLGQEDPLEKGMETHSSILAWEIPWTEESGGPQSMGLQRVGHD